MAYDGRRNISVYTTGGESIQLQNNPVVTKKAPTTSDMSEIGDVWIDTSTDSVYMLTSVVDGVATWSTSPASGVGTFTNVTASGDVIITGDLTDSGTLTLDGAVTHAIAGSINLVTDLTVGGTTTLNGDLTVTGTAAFTGDLDFTSAALIDLTSTLNADPSIYLHANGGVLESIYLRSEQGTGADAIKFTSAVGGITLTTGLAADDSITFASTGGIDASAAMKISIATVETDADSFVMSSAGGMDITATGAAAKDIDVTCTSGSINVIAGESDADAIVFNASGAAGGVRVLTGTNGLELANQADATYVDIADIVPTVARTVNISTGSVATAIADTINIGTDGATTDAGASKVVNIGTGDLDTATNTVNIGSGDVASGTHAVNISTGTGGKNVNIGNADGITALSLSGGIGVNSSVNANIDLCTGTSTGTVAIGNALATAITLDAVTFSLDATTASNITLTGAVDLTLNSTLGSVIIDGGEAAADAIQLTSSDLAGGILFTTGTGGITSVNTGALSLACTLASDITCSAADLTLESTTASVIIDGGEAAADAIQLTASDVAGGILFTSGTGGITSVNTGALSLACTLASDITCTGADLTLESVGASVVVNADEAANDAVSLNATAGGFNINGVLESTITVVGASEDLNIVVTGGSLYMESTEAVSNAIRIIASDTDGGIDVDCGTGGFVLDAADGTISLDSTVASNFSVTGAGQDLTVASIGGSVLIQSTEASTTAIRLYASDVAGGVSIEGDGLTTMEGENSTIASPIVVATVNKNVVDIIATGFTTAAGATEVFTITCNKMTTSSKVLYGCTNEGANDAQMHITRLQKAAGSFVVTITNDGAAALNGNLQFTVWIL